jgi:acetyl esterase
VRLLLIISLLCGFTASAVEPLGHSVIYKQTVEKNLRLFVMKPTTITKPCPAIIWFHGGGWVRGKPMLYNHHGSYLNTRGIISIQAEYRLQPKPPKGPPEVCGFDARSAIRYLRAHAAELQIDPTRIIAGGDSAGGHLAAFCALVPDQDDPLDDRSVSCVPDALILLNPVIDNGPDGSYGYKQMGDAYRAFSPAHHIRPSAPPCLILSGKDDKLIPVSTLERFAKGMRAAGNRCELILYEDQPHHFWPEEPYRHRTLKAMDQFLVSLSYLTGPDTLPEPIIKLKRQPSK